MEGSESIRNHNKRDVEDNVNARSGLKEEEEQDNVDGRKNRSGKSRKHSSGDEVEEPDDGRRRSSADRNESRRKSISGSGQAYSDNDDDYDVRRGSQVSKILRRSSEERSERRLSDGYMDRDGDGSRTRREDEDDQGASRRSSSKSSSHDVSHSKSRSKTEGPYDGQLDKGEGREGSKEKQGHWEQEEFPYQRSVVETHTDRRADIVEAKDRLTCLDADGHALLKDGSNKEDRDDKKYPVERYGCDRSNSDSDNERSIGMKEKTREDAYGESNSYRGRDRNRELEGSKEYWRNRQRQDSKETNDYDAVTDWRHGQERLDTGNFHGRSGYRKDYRGRYESSKGPSLYGSRYDNSDSIEIRPNRNLDFGKENSVSGRTDMGSYQDLMHGDRKSVV